MTDDVLFWVFGVELGMIDCSIHSMEQLRNEVNAKFTQQEIDEIITNY